MIYNKFEELKKIINDMQSAIVAFSGGVDSTFLVKVCSDIMKENVIAVTATSPTYPSFELEDAKKYASLIGVGHEIVDSDELEIKGFAENNPDRCYFCKKELFSILERRRKELEFCFVLDGSNADDLLDFRPGSRAASELNVRSPLKEAGLTKEEIRILSRELNLPSWNKPSFACLSSRFPYGTRITEERVAIVGEGEAFLRKSGFRQFRVRYHNQIVRIELEKSEMRRIFNNNLWDEVLNKFKELGFSYVTIDMEGYRTGSMNEVLFPSKKHKKLPPE